MKTLAYDCGNPVQYVCGHSPAVLFYLLDRHAPLAMTKGTKYPQAHTILVIPAQAGIGLGLLLVIFNRGNNSVLCFYLSVIRDMNLIDPIPALSTPQIHLYLRGPRARE